jgi:hypothetical protein
MSAELITAIIAVVSAIGVSLAAWKTFKEKLSQIRKFVDTLDDALYDNEVTEKEYQQIWEKFVSVIEFGKEGR